MGILPLNIDLQEQLNILPKGTSDKIKKSFLFDFGAGDFVIKDGKLIVIESLETLKIWIEKILRTEKFRFKIYKKEDKRLEYGVTIMDLLIGHKYPREFVKAEIEREVTETLLKHPLIKNLDNFNLEQNNKILNISFNVILKDGKTLEQEVSL